MPPITGTAWRAPHYSGRTKGKYAHAFRENANMPDLDETYGKVTIDDVRLSPSMVRTLMAQSALPSVNNRVRPIDCPAKAA
jgi:hypothetical protein